jgi:hypothetical protein
MPTIVAPCQTDKTHLLRLTDAEYGDWARQRRAGHLLTPLWAVWARRARCPGANLAQWRIDRAQDRTQN